MYFIRSKSLTEITNKFKKSITNFPSQDQGITGISSGFCELDAITKGFQPSTLSIVGGVAGIGKTSFALSLIKKIAIEKKHSTAFFSLRVPSEEFISILLCQQTNIYLSKYRPGFLKRDEINLLYNKMDEIKTAPLAFYDHAFLTVDTIEKVLFLYSPEDSFPEIIVIDSLQLLAKNKKDEVGKILNKKELTKITMQLKELAKKYKIPIILTTEIQESTIKSWYKRPNLTNVRNHAPIVNFADLILLLYRPEYYRIDNWDDADQTSAFRQGEIIIAKNTIGSCENIRVNFNVDKCEFDNLEKIPF